MQLDQLKKMMSQGKATDSQNAAAANNSGDQSKTSANLGNTSAATSKQTSNNTKFGLNIQKGNWMQSVDSKAFL